MGKRKEVSFETAFEEPLDGNRLMFCGIEFQPVGAVRWKALRPMALAVKGMCRRLRKSEEVWEDY